LQIETQIRRSIFNMSDVRKEAAKNEAFSVSYARVEEDSAGQRLDNFLIRICKGVPKSHIYRIVRSGEVRVDGKRAEAATRLVAGNEVRIPPIRLANRDAAEGAAASGARRLTFEVLFEDEALLVLSKPAGLAVHGGSGVDYGLIEALRAQRPEAKFLELAHRLDRETSGILLVGKKRPALKVLHDMFRQGGADKRYLALVAGEWTEKLKDVRLPLDKFLTEGGERRVTVATDAEQGRYAHSVFRKVDSGRRFSLVEAQIKTGRTHQIRVHLAHLGFPIAGDDKYGDFALNKALAPKGLKRMFLHAWRMRFPHPVTGAPLSFEVPLPGELAGFVDRLKSTGEW
jgi:23S rRNA pseudouridine955/2504/2580 synthase